MPPSTHDLRYALRMLARTPAFTAVAVLTLALGIGANTTIFTVVNALLLRPLPYATPERLVMVWQDFRARGGPADEWASPGNFADWREASDIFEAVAAISGWRPTLLGEAEPEPLPGEQVSYEYFSVLGITPALGRTFRAEDDVPNAGRVAVIADGLWKRRFGGDPAVIGRTVVLSGEPHEIIGVVPPNTRPIVNPEAEIWRPLRINTAAPSRGAIVLRVVGKLAPGVSLAEGQTAATALARRLESQYPASNEKVGFNLQPLHDRVVGEIRPGLVALLGAVGFVLLIACVNIANLLLARGSSRGRELAVRRALGAGRGRLVRQLLTESLTLAFLGGAAGLALGVWAVDALVALAPANAPRVDEIAVDLRVLGFTALLTVITGLIFGVAPALQSSHSGVAHALKEGGRGSAASGGRSLRRALIAVEVALALILLTGGGLLLQTFVRLQSFDLGFDPSNVLVGFVNPPRTSYDTIQKHRVFYGQVLERAAALPSVERAALASVLPFSGDSDMSFEIEGRPPASRTEVPASWYRLVSAGYFDTLGVRLRRGRVFVENEATPAVVVNETFVAKYFPAEEPLGRRVRGGPEMPWFTIVGIVGDVLGQGARADRRAQMYIPYWQFTEPGMAIILKTRTDPARLATPLKQAVLSLDGSVPVSNVAVLAEMVSDSIDQPRFVAVLAGGFAVLALLLAAIGIYGVMAYAVAQRTTEIGVRMALGATPGDVFRLVAADAMRTTMLGVMLGIGGSLVTARWLATLLFGVSPADPLTLAATAGVLLGVAAAACYLPARRATRVDPMVALRAE